MSDENKESVPDEIKATVTLLMDTEKKIEELRNQLNNLGKSESPTPKPVPPGVSTDNARGTPIASERAYIQAQMTNLKDRTLKIVKEIEKASSRETGERVNKLVQDWTKDLEPPKAGETKSIVESQKWANRRLNKDWTPFERPDETRTPFEQNKEDIDGKKASYLEKARGLHEDYAHLEKGTDAPVPSKDKEASTLEPIKEDGPDIDIDKE